MAVAIPDFQSVMLPVLRATADGEVRTSAVIDRVADELTLSPEERSNMLPSGRQTTFANRVHWALAYLGKAGLIERTRRAHYRVADRGREVPASPPDRIDIKFLGRFPEFRLFREAEVEATTETAPISADLPSDAALTPDEVIRVAHRRLEAAAADDSLQRVRVGSPTFFEKVVVRLLIAMGYGGSVVDIDRALVGGSGDGGVDGVIDQDPLGLSKALKTGQRNRLVIPCAG